MSVSVEGVEPPRAPPSPPPLSHLPADHALQGPVILDHRHVIEPLGLDDSVDEGEGHVGRDDDRSHFHSGQQINLLALQALGLYMGRGVWTGGVQRGGWG